MLKGTVEQPINRPQSIDRWGSMLLRLSIGLFLYLDSILSKYLRAY
jgi:hypothetical protein